MTKDELKKEVLNIIDSFDEYDLKESEGLLYNPDEEILSEFIALKGEVKRIALENNVENIFEIPYDSKIIESTVKGIPYVKIFPYSPITQTIKRIANFIVEGLKLNCQLKSS